MPVRCMTCGERDYAPLSLILKLRSERKARHRESRSTA
jgi:DNA-directed RNA polymerase subunit N (RpoN/RPB10)